ncbi:MAG: immunoglobulin domain-containing protein [Terracidiphilus sp.]
MRLPSCKLVHIFRPSAVALLACAALPFTGCGGQSGPPPPPPQGVVITVQPLSQTVPISETATFTVTATGTVPLSYQWSENGQEIPGADAAFYTTPAVALGDNGSTLVGSYQVRVSNAVNSVASNTVTLNAGARSPKPGDLRYLLFQQVDLPGFMSEYGGGADWLGTANYSYGNALGTPLMLGIGNISGSACDWHFSFYNLPPGSPGLAMYYQENFTVGETPFTSYLQTVAAPNLVIDSMDIQSAPEDSICVGVSWVETAQPGGFDQRLEIIPSGTDQSAQIQSQATLDGAESRVIPAVSFDTAGNAYLISYGWTGDTTTVYETQTAVVTAANVTSTATALAGEGYFLSAFGGNPTFGYMLIGTRVQGDTLPRPINANGVLAPNPDSAYFTMVVWLQDPSAGAEIWEQ